MATFNEIYRESKAANAETINFSGKKYKCIKIAEVRLAGKIKEVVLGNLIAKFSFGTDYNGFGYDNHHNLFLVTSAGKKELEILIAKSKPKTKPKTQEQIINTWAKRLAKLTGITLKKATLIANEKIEYKNEKINAMDERQYGRYSDKRCKLINKMQRENPLRRIEDLEHALSILAASNRHNFSPYDRLLLEAHEAEKEGLIERGTAKEWARTQLKTKR